MSHQDYCAEAACEAGGNPLENVRVDRKVLRLKPRGPVEGEQEISTDKDGQLLKNFYFQALPDPFRRDPRGTGRGMDNQGLIGTHHAYRAKARLISGHLTFPIMPRDEQGNRKYDPIAVCRPPELEKTDLKEPGWIYATTTFSASSNGSGWFSNRDSVLPDIPDPKQR